MTRNEKADRTAELLLPEVVEATNLLPYIDLAGEIILQRRYPFVVDTSLYKVPEKYENIQCMIAVELWNKKGAEGQTAHTENAITRSWAGVVSRDLLKFITPCAGSIVNEDFE